MSEYFNEETKRLESIIVESSKATCELFDMKIKGLIRSGTLVEKVSEQYLKECIAAGIWRSTTLKSGKIKPIGLNKALKDKSPGVRAKATVLNRLRVFESECNAYSYDAPVEEEKEEKVEALEVSAPVESEEVIEVTEKFNSVLSQIAEIARLVIENKTATKKELLAALAEIEKTASA